MQGLRLWQLRLGGGVGGRRGLSGHHGALGLDRVGDSGPVGRGRCVGLGGLRNFAGRADCGTLWQLGQVHHCLTGYPHCEAANREIGAAIITVLVSSPPPRRSPDARTRTLFLELRAGTNPDARAALVEQHLQLARRLAARYRHSPQPLEDLQQVASLALVKAVDAYDPRRGPSFVAYAVPTILGELKRHMRDATWDVHVPRALKDRVLALEQTERILTARTGRSPSVGELAAEAGATPEQVLEALAARGAHDAVPLDASPEQDKEEQGIVVPEPASADRDFRESVAERVTLSGALRRLHHREREILRLRFVDGLTQSEIAERVGLSQMHVSRLLRLTLQRLRDEID